MASNNGPGDDRSRLLAMINANWMTQAIGTAAALGVPRLLAQAPQHGAALAAATGCHEPSLRRLLHALASLGLCARCDDGRFELTPFGTLLDPDAPDSLHAWARARASHWPAWGELEQSVRSGEGFRKRRSGHDDFSHLGGDAQAAALFHRAMVDLTRRIANEVAGAVAFQGHERIVDVGGGSGELAVTLLAEHPQMRGVVFDLPHARDAALARFAGAGVADRCEFVAGSFLETVPEGGDAYLLKSVLYNWDDERAASILRRCRAAMAARSRLLVIERVAQERWSTNCDHQAVAASDLNMLVALSGRERTAAEFGALLEAAVFERMRPVAQSGDYCVIEALAR